MVYELERVLRVCDGFLCSMSVTYDDHKLLFCHLDTCIELSLTVVSFESLAFFLCLLLCASLQVMALMLYYLSC